MLFSNFREQKIWTETEGGRHTKAVAYDVPVWMSNFDMNETRRKLKTQLRGYDIQSLLRHNILKTHKFL